MIGMLFALAGVFTASTPAQNLCPFGGNVGIGTTYPVSTLEVNGTAQVDNAKPRTKPAAVEKE
jgi:hypothetical protein